MIPPRADVKPAAGQSRICCRPRSAFAAARAAQQKGHVGVHVHCGWALAPADQASRKTSLSSIVHATITVKDQLIGPRRAAGCSAVTAFRGAGRHLLSNDDEPDL